MYAPKARAVLTGSTPRKVTVLHRIDCGSSDVDKVSDVDAYMVRTSAGQRLTVPGSLLIPRKAR